MDNPLNENHVRYFKHRSEWRAWLTDHFRNAKEIWFVFPKKASGKQRISYNDAVEEALCFGWIDSTVRSYDQESYIQRFTPRRLKSSYSQPNKERLKWLAERKMLHPSVEECVRHILEEEYFFPEDIVNEIRQDEEAWKNFQQFSESYRRLRISYIDSARKRPDEFQKRLSNFLEKTRKNKFIKGHGGLEKYY